MIESSIVFYNDELVCIDVGNPSSVEFDFEKIWEVCRREKDQGTWDVKQLRFYHVHPEGFLDYSHTDLNCVKGFNLAFGGCTNFNILTFRNSKLSDLHHNLICFEYQPKTSKNTLVKLEEDWLFQGLGKEHLYLLKALSYGYVDLKKEIHG